MLFSFLFSLFLAALRHMESLGQGSNLSQSSDLQHSCNDTESLTHCAGLGIKPTILPLQRHHQSYYTTVGTPNHVFFFYFLHLLMFWQLKNCAAPPGASWFSERENALARSWAVLSCANQQICPSSWLLPLPNSPTPSSYLLCPKSSQGQEPGSFRLSLKLLEFIQISQS